MPMISRTPTVKRVRERVLLNGKYVLIHKETSADLVITESGKSVETKLNELQEWQNHFDIKVISGGNAESK